MREKIAHALTANVIRDSGATPGRPCGCNQTELASLGAPRSVVHFLQRTLARRAQIEVSERFSGSFDWFDMSGDAVQAALDNVRHTVTEAARFPADEWPKAVQHAVLTMLDYLINPVPTLLDFCFSGDSAAASVGDLRRRAGYFREYAYVEQALQAYTQKKGDKRVSRHELEATLNHVVKQYTSDFSADEWMRTMEPLLEFVHVSGHVDGGLPVTFVVAFLVAHHRPDVARIVEVEARMAKADMISAATLQRLLQEALDAAEAAAQPQPTVTPGVDDAPKPLWQQYAEQQQRERDPVSPSSAGGPAPLWKSFQDRLGSPPVPVDFPNAVHIVLGSARNQAEHFVATLFEGNSASFHDVIRRLHEASSWSEASAILARDVFQRFGIDIYSDTAVAFTNAVQSRYAQ